MDVEFKGGSMVTLSYEGDVDLPSLKSEIGSQLGQSDLTLQTGSDISGNQTLTVTLPGSQTLTTEQLDDMLTAINEAHPENNFEQNGSAMSTPPSVRSSCSRAWSPWSPPAC